MKAVIAPASASAAAAAANDPTVTMISARAFASRRPITTMAGTAAATSAISPNVANACA